MKQKHIHFIGIKGVAMTGLAIIAKEKGFKVTGSDVSEEFVTDTVLKRNGIIPIVGFSKENLKDKPDLVIVTGAHGGINNPEAQAAVSMGIRTIMQGAAMGEFMDERTGIAVCGCHGKTTTTAMIATILELSGHNPSFAVGSADVPVLGNPAKFGKGKYFIGEADEYITCPDVDMTPKFMWLNPKIIVMTNIDFDHPDAYKSIEDVKTAYLKFAQKLSQKDLLVACADNQNLYSILPKINARIKTYGLSPKAQTRPTNISFDGCATYFSLNDNGFDLGRFMLQVPGVHNVLNATASIIASLETGVSLEKIKKSLSFFTGTKRRFEKIGEKNNIKIYDDYAHHPTEIEATLKAARNWFPKNKIIIIFQPHTYSRTKALKDQFSKCFTVADEVILTDIYSSKREIPDLEINSKILASLISKNHKNVKYIGDKNNVVEYLSKNLTSGNIVFTMGAGDIYKIGEKILENI